MQRNVPLETMYSIWVHRTAGWRKAVSVRRRFINFNGRAPTVAELAEQLGLVLPDKEELLSWYEDQYEQFLRAKRNAPKKDGQRGRGRDRVLNPRSCRRRDSTKDIVLKPTEDDDWDAQQSCARFAETLQREGAMVEVKESGVVEARLPDNPCTRRIIFEFSRRKYEDIMRPRDIPGRESAGELALLLNF